MGGPCQKHVLEMTRMCGLLRNRVEAACAEEGHSTAFSSPCSSQALVSQNGDFVALNDLQAENLKHERLKVLASYFLEKG